MKETTNQKNEDVMKIISSGRERTNILRSPEQKTIAYLVQHIPSWMTSNMLTTIGFSGSIITFLGFVLATYADIKFLLLGVLGFAISWFGDSLDGRIAYYRNKARKWYGFALDITTDWLGIILMGLGFVIYVNDYWEIVGFGFVVMYGWEMITALLRYKVTGKYSIDSGLFGPTEVRIIISLILVFEILFRGSILYVSTAATAFLLISNIIETRKLLKLSDERDKREKEEKI